MCVCGGGGEGGEGSSDRESCNCNVFKGKTLYEQHPHPHGSSLTQQHMGIRSTSHTPTLANWCGLRETLPRSDRSVKAVRIKCTVWNNGNKGREA